MWICLFQIVGHVKSLCGISAVNVTNFHLFRLEGVAVNVWISWFLSLPPPVVVFLNPRLTA